MTLSRAFYDSLGTLAESPGVSRFHLLLGALCVYFVRTSQCDEVTLGLPVLNCAHGAYKQTAGLFTNQSPVRFAACGQDLSFADLLERISATLKAVYRYQRFPSSEIRRAAGVEAGRAGLSDVGLSYESHDYQAAFAGVEGHFTALLHSWEQTPLQLFVRDFHAGADVRVDFVYNQAYFTAEDIRAVQERFRLVLQTALSDPHRLIASWVILPEAERLQVLEEWNATEAEALRDRCLHQLFEQHAERTPESIALMFQEQLLGYADLNARSNALAHHLISLGIRPDDRVAIAVERSVEMVVGVLGILKAGGAYVPLDPAYPEERLAFMVADSAPVALLVHGATRERFAGLAGQVPLVDLEADAEAGREWSASNPKPSALGLNPNHLAYVIYTSGSTGKPKGVMIEHRGVAAHCLEYRDRYALSAADQVVLMAELSFDASVEQLFPVLLAGGRVILTRFELEPILFSRQLNVHGVTLLDVASVYWRSLVQAWLEQPELMAGSALRILIAGGDVMPVDVLPLWWQTSLSRSVRLVNVYGPTEATVAATSFDVTPGFNGHRIPVGRPLANTRIYVLDVDNQPLPIGVAGEMVIGGVGVARGYLNRPELTRERFLPDPYSAEPEGRMYRTGDLARWLPDGTLEFLGRVDFQVKIRGFRIELGEIESALRGCDGICEAVVLAREDAPGEKRLVAYVTPEPPSHTAGRRRDTGDTTAVAAAAANSAALPAELKARLQSRLPSHMVPAAFVVLESLPLTPNGKLDRKALPEPEADAYSVRAYEPPEGPVEEALAGLWSELLGVERVGRHDDFFALGGHSLLALRLLSELDQTFGIRLSVGVVFLRPTPAGLAEAVGDSRLAEEAAALVPLRLEGEASPLFLLPGAIGSVLYLQPLAEALGDRPVLALPSPGLDGRLPLGSMKELAAHHLRTLRRQQPGGPYFLAGHSSGRREAFELARAWNGRARPWPVS